MIVYDMTPRWVVVGLLALSPVFVTPAVLAQQTPAPAPKQAPPPDDLEPGVNTSSMPSSSSAAPASTPAPSRGSLSAPKDSKPTSDSATAAAKPAAAKAGKRTSNPPAGAATNSSGRGSNSEAHVELDTTDITGNQELPKVLYIVPWKKSDLGDLLGKPANSLLDEVLQPVDRDVFKRENRYYDALKPDAASGATKGADAGTGAASQGSGDKR